MGQVRRPDARWLSLVLLALGAGGIEACSAITGLSNVSRDDAVETGETDASLGGDGGNGLGGTQYADGGMVTFVDGDTPVSTCTPDPTWCENRCGDVMDNCNEVRHCSSDCGTNNTCNTATNQCSCVPIPGLCNLKCDTITDNCGATEDCGDCPTDGGIPQTCTSNACGCVPEPVSTTCGAQQCGTAVNKCGQTVLCGVNGNCANTAQECQGTSCCTPTNACGTSCAGQQLSDGCGRTITCPTTCPAGDVCSNGSCCLPNSSACGTQTCGTAVNNCGQTISCGSCTAPYVCGSNNLCSCTPTTSCATACNATTDGCGNALSCAGYCEDVCPNGGTCLATGVCHCIVTCEDERAQAIANGMSPLSPDLPVCPQP